MKRMFFLLIAVAPAMAIAAGDDSRWLSIGRSPSGIETSVDKETVVRSGGNVTVWLRFTNGGKPLPRGDARVTEHKARIRYSCEAMTATYLSQSMHDNKGEYISGGPLSSVEAISPDSVNESVWRLFCTNP
ncbi:TPA: surface-adhesin E family protein [Stenotrophomonas maltophilia]|uniref:surface-adhesin E family protein n=1 Tax=Stenotrophomonas maltophilia TaxID=40324 RepID=UPI00131017C6|nr:surface-adhesin E family protein [Stenotrophomonas maltophilia]MDZ5773262.1 hypothetical protein [Stenotrophomonas maltophilia]